MQKQQRLIMSVDTLKVRVEEAQRLQAEKMKHQQLEQRIFQFKLLVAGAILGSTITVLFQLVFM